jgi:hypothetical protein
VEGKRAGGIGGDGVGVVGGGDVVEGEVEAVLAVGFDAEFVDAVDGDEGGELGGVWGAEELGGLGVGEDEGRGRHEKSIRLFVAGG